ncbi:MAG: sensor domain-containing protein, partial [Luteimonas sp.]
AVTVSLLSVSLGLASTPLLVWLGYINDGMYIDHYWLQNAHNLWWQLPLVFAAGVALLFATLHLLRGIGRMHGAFAKQLLVKA